MSDKPLAHRLLLHDRVLVCSALLLVIALSWVYLLAGAGTMEEMGGMEMPMSSGPWTMGHAVIMALMWAVMMAAMMLPSAAPLILLLGTIGRTRQARGGGVETSGFFALGYLAVWSGFSILATLMQFALERAALLSPMMEMSSQIMASLVLISAGLYQWTPLKQSCLRHCRSPLEFVLTRWQEGRFGAFKMGLEHGGYCVGCCWLIMLLLFVGGVMNLMWITGIALFVLVEKLAPAGHWTGKVAGAALLTWGLAGLLTTLA